MAMDGAAIQESHKCAICAIHYVRATFPAGSVNIVNMQLPLSDGVFTGCVKAN